MKFLVTLLFGFLGYYIHAQENTSIKLDIAPKGKIIYGVPSDVGLDSLHITTKVDSIMTLGIQKKAFPGAQLLVAAKGRIIYHQAFGYHTYDSLQPVSLNDIYDLASVTKITGPLPALMKLVDEGRLNLDVPFSQYWEPWQRIENKKDLTLREILAHQAGLTTYIVFLNTVYKNNGRLKKRFIRTKPNARFRLEAYDGLFVRNNFNKTMYRMIDKSAVGEKKYKYSGLTFLIFPELIEQLTGQSYEAYLSENFYAPLGATTLGFRPQTKNYSNKIVPTEIDTMFRKTLTQNWVHDENASLLGGVSGNAGLFATATDMAKIMQLYIQFGSYDGEEYISEKTIKEFIKVQYPENENRRGLGFDKPLLGNDTLALNAAYPAPQASPESFGHSGFTGTFVWADPKDQLVFIFLSNRVYPSRAHRNLYELNIRTALHSVFYEAKTVLSK